jgi:hypothetical protein
MKARYNDWRKSFDVILDEEIAKRIETVQWPWRKWFDFLIECTKTKTHTLISSDFITLYK